MKYAWKSRPALCPQFWSVDTCTNTQSPEPGKETTITNVAYRYRKSVQKLKCALTPCYHFGVFLANFPALLQSTPSTTQAIIILAVNGCEAYVSHLGVAVLRRGRRRIGRRGLLGST